MTETIKAIEAIIAEADTMKKSYFFNPPTTAGARRSYEKRHSHGLVEWAEGGHTYTAQYTVTCTCGNVYAVGEYTRDGNKTTITTVKNSLKRLEMEG